MVKADIVTEGRYRVKIVSGCPDRWPESFQRPRLDETLALNRGWIKLRKGRTGRAVGWSGPASPRSLPL